MAKEEQVDPRVGTWKTKSVSVDGRELTQKQIENNGFDLVVVLKDDGTGTLTINSPEISISDIPVNYTEDTVTASYMGISVPYKLDGSTVVADYTYNDTVYTITLEKSN